MTTNTTPAAKVCDTCQKRLSTVNRAPNGIQCNTCHQAALASAEADRMAAERAAKEAAAHARKATRHDDPELLELALQFALEFKRAQENLIKDATYLAEKATQMAAGATEGQTHLFGIGTQTPFDVHRYEAEMKAAAQALRRLLHIMGRVDDFDSMVADPWNYWRTVRAEQ